MSAHKGGFVFTGRHMLFIMVAFFGVVIAVNILMAMKATSSFTGLIARNGYVASIDFARDEEARAAAAARGWQIHLTAPGGIATLEVRDAAGAPLAATHSVTYEPAGKTGEAIPLTLDGVGGILRAREPLPPGNWVLRAHIGPVENPITWRSVVTVPQ